VRADLLQLAADLTRRGEAFALATVVRRGPPSSSREGDSALITEGGTFHGWLGGSCTEPLVVAEALRALADGAPRMIALSPDPAGETSPGLTVLPMTCHSGGSVQIYIVPVLPPARVVVFGASPVARALARLAKAAGFTVTAVDPEADRASFPEADDVFTTLDGSVLRQRPGLRGAAVRAVVATMGRCDEDAALAALSLEPSYLGVVSSRRRFDELARTLRERGAAPPAVEAIRCPAGLDIGARRPEEIALSILAEIVQHAAQRPPGPKRAEAVERDPVCGMSVAVADARHTAEHGGRAFCFCGAGCRARFLADPERYLAAEGAR
jgi:xanthine dehydrogenase accessory factor